MKVDIVANIKRWESLLCSNAIFGSKDCGYPEDSLVP